MGYEIDVRERVISYVGRKTLNDIEQDIKKLKEQGEDKIVINMGRLSIREDNIKYLAWLKYKYGCKYKGLGSNYIKLDAYINTGYFLKRSLGVEGYVKWFKRIVKSTGYRLMFRDHRLKKYRLVPINIIKPIKFEENKFFYKVIKPQYLEPIYLEEAVKTGKELYTEESIQEVDISKGEEGFRFASTLEERYTLDIFESIIKGKMKGFIRDVRN